jgi:hypothetical protein
MFSLSDTGYIIDFLFHSLHSKWSICLGLITLVY